MDYKQNKIKFWLECYTNDQILHVEPLLLMRQQDFNQLVEDHPKRFHTGMYSVWGDGDQEKIQCFVKNKIDCKKYRYNLITRDFIEILKTIKSAKDDFEIEWFNKITGKKEGDNHLIGNEKMPQATAQDLCRIFGFNMKNYPFDGLCQKIFPQHKEIQKYLQHLLDFDKYKYFITNSAKGINCAEWDKWLPI